MMLVRQRLASLLVCRKVLFAAAPPHTSLPDATVDGSFRWVTFPT